MICLVLAAAGMRFWSWSARWALGILSGAVVLAGGIGSVCFLRMPVVPVRMESRFEWLRAPDRAEGVSLRAGDKFKAGDPLPSVEAVRAAIRKVLRGHPALVSRPMIEEDSPRNYIVRAVPGDVEMVYCNDHGQEQVYSIREFMAEGR